MLCSQAARRFLAADVDLGQLEAPGVDTFVSYGYGLDTVVGAAYTQDITPGARLSTPAFVMGSGDNTVPVRSSLRAREMWRKALNMQGRRLEYHGYDQQPHAQCWQVMKSKL